MKSNIKEPEKSIPNDLEEAAEEYAEGIIQREDALMCKQAFITGAKWSRDQVLNKVVTWLKENAGNYWFDDFDVDCPEELLNDFRDAMSQNGSEEKYMQGDIIMELKVGMHGEPIEIILDKYAQRARGIFPGDELTVILRIKK